MTDPANTAELKRLAEAVGIVSWHLNDYRPEGEILVCGGEGMDYGLYATVNDELPDVASFIAAANPSTVLSLISTIERQAEEIARWISAYEIAHDQASENGAAARKYKEEVAALRDAIKVFADCADELDGSEDVPRAPDGEWAKFRLLTDDYRKARDAYAKQVKL